MMPETGPIYGVRLITSLPMGGMFQAMPSRQDLENNREVCQGERVVAGYEVLLSHYLRQQKIMHVLANELAEWSGNTFVEELQNAAEVVDESED